MACDRGLHVDAEVRRGLLETVLHAADEVVEEREDHRLVARRVERAAVVPVREVRPDLPRLAEHAERVVDARRELLVLPLVEEVGRHVDVAEAGIRRSPDPLVRAVVVEGVLEDQRRDEVLRLFVREFVLGEVLLALDIAVRWRARSRVGVAPRLLIAGPGEGEVVLEDAAGIGDVAVEVRRGRVGSDGAEVGRPVRRSQQLRDGAEADADHSDASVGPRLPGGPLDRVGAVATHGQGERVEHALRAAGPAHRDPDERVPALQQPVAVDRDAVVGSVRPGGVALVVDEHRVARVPARAKHVVTELRSVPRGEIAVRVDGRGSVRRADERNEYCGYCEEDSTYRAQARFAYPRAVRCKRPVLIPPLRAYGRTGCLLGVQRLGNEAGLTFDCFPDPLSPGSRSAR